MVKLTVFLKTTTLLIVGFMGIHFAGCEDNMKPEMDEITKPWVTVVLGKTTMLISIDAVFDTIRFIPCEEKYIIEKLVEKDWIRVFSFPVAECSFPASPDTYWKETSDSIYLSNFDDLSGVFRARCPIFTNQFADKEVMDDRLISKSFRFE